MFFVIDGWCLSVCSILALTNFCDLATVHEACSRHERLKTMVLLDCFMAMTLSNVFYGECCVILWTN